MKNKTGNLRLLLLLSFLCVACTQQSNIYEGKKIEIDFRNIEDIKDGAWIIVDGVKYTHYEEYEKSESDEYSVPASRSMYEVGGAVRYEPRNSFQIAIMLGNYIDVNSTKVNNEIARVKIDERNLMLAFGIIRLHHVNGNDIMVETSKEYTPKITVLE